MTPAGRCFNAGPAGSVDMRMASGAGATLPCRATWRPGPRGHQAKPARRGWSMPR